MHAHALGQFDRPGRRSGEAQDVTYQNAGQPVEMDLFGGAMVTERKEDVRVTLSSVSAPSIIAVMLHRADLRPGHRGLESGPGCDNAALVAHLAGPTGLSPWVQEGPGTYWARVSWSVRVAGRSGQRVVRVWSRVVSSLRMRAEPVLWEVAALSIPSWAARSGSG